MKYFLLPGVYLKGLNLNLKKAIPALKLSPCQFKMFHKNEAFENSGVEILDGQKKLKNKETLLRSRPDRDMGTTDWSTHEMVTTALSYESPGSETNEARAELDSKKGILHLVHVWLLAQLDSVVSNAGFKVNSLVVGSKTLLHFVLKGKLLKQNRKTQGLRSDSSKDRHSCGEPSLDILYVLSVSDESLNAKKTDAYDLAFDGCFDKRNSKCFEVLLPKLQLGDAICMYVGTEKMADKNLDLTISSLNWMGSVVSDVFNRLTALLSLNSAIMISSYDLPSPGHILIYGPPGSGKTLLAKVAAKSVEDGEEILAHTVFVNCSKLTAEKQSTIRQAISGYIAEAFECVPSILIFDDLDSLVSSSSNLEGSQQSASSAELTQFLVDILDEYEEKRRSMCGIGPVAFIATVQSLASLPQTLSSSGRFDFHVKLLAPAAAERTALLKQEIQKRSLECPGKTITDVASKCDGYDAYDLEILVDRSVHAAVGRFLSNDLGSRGHQKPTLVEADFLHAMHDFLPVAMRDITKPSSEDSRSGWEDVGGLDEIRNSIKEMIELPSKFPTIFSQAPLRMRSNVLLYGPPGCGKTHIVGAAAAACSLRFISVKGPELLNKYIGASEQAVRDIFSKAAAAAPCLLFFDEFDSIAPKRGHDNTGVTDRVVNQFLTELDGVEVLTGVFVFAATSRPDLLDAALLRPGRLDRLLFCDFPSKSERLDILKVLSRKLPLTSDVDLGAIAHMTEGFSGADLQALLSDAQLEAVHDLLSTEKEKTGKMPVISDALLKSTASKAKASVSESEKQRLYDIYRQFLDSKRSVAAQVGKINLF